MDWKGDPMKMNFDNFQMQKWVSETGLEKQMEKDGHLFDFQVSFLIYGP